MTSDPIHGSAPRIDEARLGRHRHTLPGSWADGLVAPKEAGNARRPRKLRWHASVALRYEASRIGVASYGDEFAPTTELSMKRAVWGVCAVLATFAWTTEATALRRCEAVANRSDATIQISARQVKGSLRWGRAALEESNAFTDPACIKGTRARACTLAQPSTTAPITHFNQCLVYLADDVSSCVAYVNGCGPSGRVPLVVDDFQESALPWVTAPSGPPTGTIAGNAALRVPAGSSVHRTVDIDLAHTTLLIRATVHLLDDWQGEVAYLKVDGLVVWTRSFNSPAVIGGVSVSGTSPAFPDLVGIPLEVAVPSATSSVNIEFGTTLDSGSQGWMAVDDVLISVY
jgi:hypothetical protein